MVTWMRSFGDLRRIGVECTGSYGAGLLRYMQAAGVEVLEVTAPDELDRRRLGKNDDFDAQSAAHAAFAERRSLKYECVYLHAWETGSQAKAGVDRWISFYNHQRPYAAHGGQPPAMVYFNQIAIDQQVQRVV